MKSANTPRTQCLAPFRRVRRIVIPLVLSWSVSAAADKLDDFKDAVNRAGCDSIPYSDLRSSCHSQQSEVHPWCDGDRGPVTCNANGTSELRTKLEQEAKHLATLTEKRRDLDDKRSRAADDTEKARLVAELEALDKEIDASRKRHEQLKRDLENRKSFVEKAMYTLGKCLDYRRAVMNIYAYTTDQVRGEREPEIKPYAAKLRDKYGESIRGHEIQISNKTNALENCRKELP